MTESHLRITQDGSNPWFSRNGLGDAKCTFDSVFKSHRLYTPRGSTNPVLARSPPPQGFQAGFFIRSATPLSVLVGGWATGHLRLLGLFWKNAIQLSGILLPWMILRYPWVIDVPSPQASKRKPGAKSPRRGSRTQPRHQIFISFKSFASVFFSGFAPHSMPPVILEISSKRSKGGQLMSGGYIICAFAGRPKTP